MRFDGKTVLVTGGAVRVGAAVARAFAAEGAALIVHCRYSRAAAEALVAELPGRNHRIVEADLEKPGAAETLFRQIEGPVDILINNASRYRRFESVLKDSEEEDRRFFQVNYLAPVALMREFAVRRQTLSGEGAIVNLLDQEVDAVVPHGGAYAHSRRALRGATLEFARELAPRIRVNGIAPGPVLPPPWLPPGGHMEKTLQRVPLARPVALTDLVEAVLFLAGNRSVTGTILLVDCGQHLGRLDCPQIQN